MRRGHLAHRWGLPRRWSLGLKRFFFILTVILPLPLSPAIPVPPPDGDPPPPIRSGTWDQDLRIQAPGSLWSLAPQSYPGEGLTLLKGSTRGLYASLVRQADFPFNAIALAWKGRIPSGSQVVMEVRASSDGQDWSEWFKAEPLDGFSSQEGEYRSQLMVVRGLYLQYSATFYASDSDLAPSLEAVSITYIDSSRGPTVVQTRSGGARALGGVINRPALISRAGWGSPEPDSSTRWPPQYRDWKKVIIHDTVTKNDDPDPAATVRAIWYYHANTLGWGDIGYNFLIDRFGNIYEGRFGGENAVGGHALPCYNYGSIGVALLGDYRYAEVSPTMEEALLSLLTWTTYQHEINPLGSGYFGERWLPNIFAHRDVRGSCGNTHTDPGAYVYDRLPEFREKVWGRFPQYGQNWVGHDTPPRMLAGETASVAVTVQNKGRAFWSSSATNPFRLGYRWYGQDGTQLFQGQDAQQRSDLPVDIPFGHTVIINSRVTAPASAGTYTLRWDMVQEGVTWFSDQGNPTLDVTVVVNEPTYIAEFVGQSSPLRLFAGERGQAWVEVKNVGTAVWYRSGANPVKLGTWNPTDRASALATAGDWETPWRATYLDQERVFPGQVGRFTFLATGTSQPGLYREYFRLVAEGKTWFGPTLYLDFTVSPTIKTFLPRVSNSYGGGW